MLALVHQHPAAADTIRAVHCAETKRTKCVRAPVSRKKRVGVRPATALRCMSTRALVVSKLSEIRGIRRPYDKVHVFCGFGYARIAAMSGWMPTMFITRVTL